LNAQGAALTTPQLLTPYQSQFYAWQLTRRTAGDSVEALASTLVDSQVDLNPHQVEAALFACQNPLSKGVILEAKSKAKDIEKVDWDLVVLDEAHRLRNVCKPGNVIGKTLQDALKKVGSKVLLTATPLQNSLLELYGLVSVIDDKVFGSLDSFRAQFSGAANQENLDRLKARLAPICQRTLRHQVHQYVPYTARRAIVEEFTPSPEEKQLATLIADYLARPNLKALPAGQRPLISLVLWMPLASASYAIAGALETMANRLQGVADGSTENPELSDKLDEDYESLAETADEWNEAEQAAQMLPAAERDALLDEIDELRQFKALANGIQDNAKGKALLTALERAFAELEKLGAPRKAIIFTESRRTQDYLLSLLKDTPYGDGIVLFNGTNSDARAQTIYKNWLKQHAGTDRISGSKTADTRAALVEHFRERGTVMIATEAGAEGINLQFCSLVINYDLPWNPQAIDASFQQLRKDLSAEINEAMVRTRKMLLKNFDEQVQEKLRTRGADIEQRAAEVLRQVNKRNLGYFQQEVDKLDAWAEDLKLGLEQEIKDIDAEIKDIRRTAATAPTLAEKLAQQKRMRELEGRRSKLRRDLFARQDDIEEQRNGLIGQLEGQLQQQVVVQVLFTIEWQLL
jgi:F0F1-type ATP synthase membrane subunit b/b'